MKRVWSVCSALALVFAWTIRLDAQVSSTPQDARPLVLTEAIPLEGIKGRFDHFGTSGRRLFVSALGNNTVEVIDISGRTLEHTITGVPNPHGGEVSLDSNERSGVTFRISLPLVTDSSNQTVSPRENNFKDGK